MGERTTSLRVENVFNRVSIWKNFFEAAMHRVENLMQHAQADDFVL